MLSRVVFGAVILSSLTAFAQDIPLPPLFGGGQGRLECRDQSRTDRLVSMLTERLYQEQPRVYEEARQKATDIINGMDSSCTDILVSYQTIFSKSVRTAALARAAAVATDRQALRILPVILTEANYQNQEMTASYQLIRERVLLAIANADVVAMVDLMDLSTTYSKSVREAAILKQLDLSGATSRVTMYELYLNDDAYRNNTEFYGRVREHAVATAARLDVRLQGDLVLRLLNGYSQVVASTAAQVIIGAGISNLDRRLIMGLDGVLTESNYQTKADFYQVSKNGLLGLISQMDRRHVQVLRDLGRSYSQAVREAANVRLVQLI